MTRENQHVYEHFLDALAAAYGPPNKGDVEGFMAVYARMLKQYVPSELKLGVEHVLQSHKGPHRWPRIPECVAGLERARNHILAKREVAARQKNPRQQQDNRERTAFEIEQGWQFVRDCAAGRIDMGPCHASLRKLALSMLERKARRARQEGRA